MNDNLFIMSTKRISGIYTITNKINGKIYIGESLDIYKRWNKEHIPQLRNHEHYNNLLQMDFDKYGKDNFEFQILERYSEDSPLITKARILILESYFIDSYKKAGICLYNLENSLAEILKGNKIPEEGNTLINIIILTLSKYHIKFCDGFAYFDKRNSIEHILFDYIKPQKGETKQSILNEFMTFLNSKSVYLSKYINEYSFSYVINNVKSNVKIEEIKEDKVQYMIKMSVLFSEYKKQILLSENTLNEQNVKKKVFDSIGEGEIRFSNLFKIFEEDGTLPCNYNYQKVREFLVNMNVIFVKEMIIEGVIKKVTFATDNALSSGILRVIGSQKQGDNTIFRYVFTKKGVADMKNKFSSIDEERRKLLFQ